MQTFSSIISDIYFGTHMSCQKEVVLTLHLHCIKKTVNLLLFSHYFIHSQVTAHILTA